MDEPKSSSGEPGTEKSIPAVDLPIPAKKSSPFSANTRFGRFLRDLARALAVVVGLVGIGALLVYFFLLRPLQQEQKILSASATQTADELIQVNANLQKARQELASNTQRMQGIQTSMEDQQAGMDILRAVNQLLLAQVAILNKDPQAAASYVSAAEELLKSTLEAMEKSDKDQADSIRALFTLAKNDIDRDPKLFAQDIERLQNELEMIEEQMR